MIRENIMAEEPEATHLQDNRYAVRPKGCLGTMGWKDGKAWDVIYINATNEQEAIRKAERYIAKRG
jgi:hypothetical protein